MLRQRPRIGVLWQFATISFVVMVALGVVLGWMLGRTVEQNVLQESADEARDIASLRVIRQLSPDDFHSPMAGERYDSFQRFVQDNVVSGRTARIKLWSTDGAVIYSDDASQVGQRFPIGEKLGASLQGEVAMSVSQLQNAENAAERQYGRLLEVYVPVVYPGSPSVHGALEVYQFYEPVAGYIQESQRSLYIALAVGLFFMYAALFAGVKRADDTIWRQQSSLSSLVTEKATLLASVQEQSADLQQRNQQLALLNRVATDLSRSISSSEVLSTGLRLALESTGLPKGVIWLFGTGQRVELAAQIGLQAEDEAFLKELPGRSPALKQALRSGQPLLMDRDTLRSLPIPESLSDRVPTFVLLAPLLSRGNVLGAVGLYTTVEEFCSEEAVNLAQAIGAELGVTLESTRRYEEARRQADHDPVTGLLNHRAFRQRLEQEFSRAQRTGRELALVMMDLDGFKLFNDTYGHPAGDQVLKQVASLLSRPVRASDVLGRYGGDEFVALLPETGTAGAVALAERFRTAMAGATFVPPDGPAVPIHVSFGIATYPHDARHTHELVGLADGNLYASKRRGGNTITFSDHTGAEDDLARTGSFGVLDGLVTAVDNKDHYTRQHSEDVTNYAISIAEAIGLSEEAQRTLRIAGLLHDVGKIGVPDRILQKPGRLEDEEAAILKRHVALGEMIIKDVPDTASVVAAVGSHHERFDGAGYPRGQKGDEIPLLGRILAVADAYSAMTTDRPYRKAFSPQKATAELQAAAGSHLDAELVHTFLGLLPAAAPAGGNGSSSEVVIPA